jgi:hypothetical protein
MNLDSRVWGPHFWFFLHTITLSYPIHPNTPIKKKYYDLIHNLPLFIPIKSMSTYFSKLLDEYPVTPYLDSRDSFIRWMHFIHNKINVKLEKPTISLSQFYENYYQEYKTIDTKNYESYAWKSKLLYLFIIISIISIIIYLYNK